MTRHIAGILCFVAATLSAQNARPAFDIASVKPRPQGPSPVLGPRRPDAYYALGTTVMTLVQFAYNLRPGQVIGLPEWAKSEFYEINARAAGTATDDEKRPMMLTLLEERFKLVAHRERRDMRHATLVMARPDRRPGPALAPCPDGPPPPTPFRIPFGSAIVPVTCDGTIEGVTITLARRLDLPVINGTAFTGRWQGYLVYADPTWPLRPPPPNVVVEDLPSLPKALEEQFGMRLEYSVGPVDVVVVESVDRPTPD